MSEALTPGTVFRALLASPCVGRDPDTGQLDASRVAGELVEALGGRVKILRQRWSFERVGGFNRKWRLEVPQALACAAGSVLVLEAIAYVPLADLLAIEHGGLGERRVEGFGRVVFLEAPVPTLRLRTPAAGTAPQAPAESAPEVVRFAEGRLLDAAVARAIEQEAARLARRATEPPTPSALGRLRNAMRAEPVEALKTLRAWLAPEGTASLRRTAMDQLERCRVGDERRRLSDWLRTLAGDDASTQIAKHLRLEALAQRSAIVSEATAEEHLRRRAPSIRAQLIDSTLAALAREVRKERVS